MRRTSGLPRLIQAGSQYEIALIEIDRSGLIQTPRFSGGLVFGYDKPLSVMHSTPCSWGRFDQLGDKVLDRQSRYLLSQQPVLGQAAPGTPQQLRCFHPGVDQGDQLYLPSTPDTLKSGAPPQSWI